MSNYSLTASARLIGGGRRRCPIQPYSSGAWFTRNHGSDLPLLE